MVNAIEQVTADMLEAFADAWSRHDADALMSFMTQDWVFEASAGSDICGTRYAGREADLDNAQVLHWDQLNNLHLEARTKDFPH